MELRWKHSPLLKSILHLQCITAHIQFKMNKQLYKSRLDTSKINSGWLFLFWQHQPELCDISETAGALQSSEKGPVLQNSRSGCGERALLATSIKTALQGQQEDAMAGHAL